MSTEYVQIPEGAVIIVRGLDLDFDEFAKAMHFHYPRSLLIHFAHDETFETMDPQHLRTLLEELIRHQEAADAH